MLSFNLHKNFRKPTKLSFPTWKDDEGAGYEWVADKLHLEPDQDLVDPKQYQYEYVKLVDIQTSLNASKARLDPIYQHHQKSWETFLKQYRGLESLRGERGLISQKYGGEIVSNAWLKMYELLGFCHQHLAALEASKRRVGFHTLHLAEAPGNFVLATNHYLTKLPKLANEWVWTANSYREITDNGGYLGDSYGLIRDYPANWYWGPDVNGDITSPAFIRDLSYRNKVQLVSSDVKYVPKNSAGSIDYHLEEQQNQAVQYGHMLSAWAVLDKAPSVAILKEFSHCTASSVARLYLMCCAFDQVYVTKPMSSRDLNSETYIVGLDLTSNKYLAALTEYLDYIRFRTDIPAPLLKSSIPESFVDRVVEIESKLANRQIKAMDEALVAYKKFTETGKVEASDLAGAWIKANSVDVNRQYMIKKSSN